MEPIAEKKFSVRDQGGAMVPHRHYLNLQRLEFGRTMDMTTRQLGVQTSRIESNFILIERSFNLVL